VLVPVVPAGLDIIIVPDDPVNLPSLTIRLSLILSVPPFTWTQPPSCIYRRVTSKVCPTPTSTIYAGL